MSISMILYFYGTISNRLSPRELIKTAVFTYHQKGFLIVVPYHPFLEPFIKAKAFARKKTGIFYRRYMDDIIILIDNERRYRQSRKRLFHVLRKLRLQISTYKTRMGKLTSGFHFLGVNFERKPPSEGKT